MIPKKERSQKRSNRYGFTDFGNGDVAIYRLTAKTKKLRRLAKKFKPPTESHRMMFLDTSNYEHTGVE